MGEQNDQQLDRRILDQERLVQLEHLAESTERLARAAQDMSERGMAIEQGIIDALYAQMGKWRRATILMAVVALVLVAIAVYNNRALNSLEKNQRNTEEIVDFVRDLRPILCKNNPSTC